MDKFCMMTMDAAGGTYVLNHGCDDDSRDVVCPSGRSGVSISSSLYVSDAATAEKLGYISFYEKEHDETTFKYKAMKTSESVLEFNIVGRQADYVKLAMAELVMGLWLDKQAECVTADEFFICYPISSLHFANINL